MPNRPKGTSTKPASVVSLNSIRRDEELDRHDEEADDDDQPGDQQDDDLDEVLEEATKPIRPEMESRIGLPASMPTWASRPG